MWRAAAGVALLQGTPPPSRAVERLWLNRTTHANTSCGVSLACSCFYRWSRRCFSIDQFRMFLALTWLSWGFLHVVMWHEMARRDMVPCFHVAWHDMTWHDMTWFPVFMWHGMAWHGFLFSCDMTWHDMVSCFHVTWHGMTWVPVSMWHVTWHGMTRPWHDTAWHDMSCGGLRHVHDGKAQALLPSDGCSRFLPRTHEGDMTNMFTWRWQSQNMSFMRQTLWLYTRMSLTTNMFTHLTSQWQSHRLCSHTSQT